MRIDCIRREWSGRVILEGDEAFTVEDGKRAVNVDVVSAVHDYEGNTWTLRGSGVTVKADGTLGTKRLNGVRMAWSELPMLVRGSILKAMRKGN